MRASQARPFFRGAREARVLLLCHRLKDFQLSDDQIHNKLSYDISCCNSCFLLFCRRGGATPRTTSTA
jgi:hypothetical protein